jgi:hypothetical protein
MSRPCPAEIVSASTSAAPPFLKPNASGRQSPRSWARSDERSGSCPTRATVASAGNECSSFASGRMASSRSAVEVRRGRPSQISAAISAVRRARGSGLDKRPSGRETREAKPRAAFVKRCSPRGVSGRSSSRTPGVPRGKAEAWRMSSRRTSSSLMTSRRRKQRTSLSPPAERLRP